MSNRQLQELAESIAKNSDAYTGAWHLACIINNAMKKQGISDEHYSEIEKMIDAIHESQPPEELL